MAETKRQEGGLEEKFVGIDLKMEDQSGQVLY